MDTSNIILPAIAERRATFEDEENSVVKYLTR